MKLPVIRFVVVSFVLLSSGCAGTNFIRATDDSLVLGQTTQEQIKARLGSPFQEGVVTKNEQQLKTSNYAYANAGGGADADGVIPARSQGFYFFNDKLVGYEFTSSYKEDSTNFDSGLISQIKKGTSTRSDVVRLLGNPGGKYIYPVIDNNNEQGVNYMYTQTRGSAFSLKFYQKILVITFDKDDVVTKVDYTESGQK